MSDTNRNRMSAVRAILAALAFCASIAAPGRCLAGESSISLEKGWNLVSFGNSSGATASIADLKDVFELGDKSFSAVTSVSPGRAYWVHSESKTNIALKKEPPALNASVRVQLKTGWNHLGNPFAHDILLSNLLIDGAPADESSCFAGGPFVYSAPDPASSYTVAFAIKQWGGFLVKAAADCELEINPLASMSSGSVEKINKSAKEAKTQWKAETNWITELPTTERLKLAGVTRPENEDNIRTPAGRDDLGPDFDLPSRFDWRENNGNWMSPVLKIATPAGGAAAASSGALESAAAIARGRTPAPDLAERQLIDLGNDSEKPAALDEMLAFIADTGLLKEECYQTASMTDSCSGAAGAAKRSAGYYYIHNDRELIKKALIKFGPLVTVMDVNHDFFAYSGGVYSATKKDRAGALAVLIVGYNEAEGYWIAKNSWGSDWGESGYFRIAYGESDIDKWVIALKGADSCNINADCGDNISTTLDYCDKDTDIRACVNTTIACGAASDCPSEKPVCMKPGTKASFCIACYDHNSCNDGDAMTLDVCSNPKTPESSCSHERHTCNVDKDCPNTQHCINGDSLNSFCSACADNTGCDDRNPLTRDICDNPGTANAACSHNKIACNSSADCSVVSHHCVNEGTTKSFCSVCVSENDCDDENPLSIDRCDNAGKTNAICSHTKINCIANNDCPTGAPICIDGGDVSSFCASCIDNSNCDDKNPLTLDYCENPGSTEATCINTQYACNYDSDCPGNGSICIDGGNIYSFCSRCLGNETCDDGNIRTNDICSLPYTPEASCSNIKTTCSSVRDCPAGWLCSSDSDGEMSCKACEENSECDDGDDNTVDTCENPGTTQATCVNFSGECKWDLDCPSSMPFCAWSWTENTGHCSMYCQYDDNCSDNNRFTLARCANPGTSQATCVYTQIACSYNFDCPSTTPFCVQGGTEQSRCAARCEENNDCDDNNSRTIDTCANPGTETAACERTNITCGQNWDCSGATQYCHNPGTSSSMCVACDQYWHCYDRDILTIDACNNPGTTESACSNTRIECVNNNDCHGEKPYCLNGGSLTAVCSACNGDEACDNTITLHPEEISMIPGGRMTISAYYGSESSLADRTILDLSGDDVQFVMSPPALGTIENGIFTAGETDTEGSISIVRNGITSAPMSVRIRQGEFLVMVIETTYPSLDCPSVCYSANIGDSRRLRVLALKGMRNWDWWYDENTSEITTGITWEVSDASIAEISNGYLVPKQPGLVWVRSTVGEARSDKTWFLITGDEAKEFLLIGPNSWGYYNYKPSKPLKVGDYDYFWGMYYCIGAGNCLGRGNNSRTRMVGDKTVVYSYNQTLNWSSSNNDVATWSYGAIMGKSKGTTSVSATYNGIVSNSIDVEVWDFTSMAFCDPANINSGYWEDDHSRADLETDCREYGTSDSVNIRYTASVDGDLFWNLDNCLDLYVLDANDNIVRTLREEGCSTHAPGRSAARALTPVYQNYATWDQKDDAGNPVPPGDYYITAVFYIIYDPSISIPIHITGTR